MKRTFFSTHALPLIGYLALTVLITWPVLPRFLSHIPGGGDAPWFLWQFWWFKHALLDLRQSPFTTDLIFYPLTDVPVTIQTPINEFFTLPLQVAVGVVPLYNLLFLASYVLSGYFAYLLGLALVRRRDLAFVGGVLFAFCAYRGMRGLGHMSLLTTQWMPLALLLALQCWRRPTATRALAAGVVAGLVALSSPYYLGLFLLPVLFVSGFYLLIWQWRSLWRRPRWVAGTVAALVFVGMSAPFYLPLLLADAEIYQVNQELVHTTSEQSADLLSWLLPAGLHPVWGKVTAPLYQHFTTPNLMETTVFVGILPLVLAGLSFGLPRRRNMLRFWQLLALTSGALALGPQLHINGQTILEGLPFQWLLYVPGFDAFRAPSRAGITTALAVSMLTIMTLQQVRVRFSARVWRIILPVLTALVLVNVTPFFPYPTAETTIPAVYNDIAQADDRQALLELPAGEYFHRNGNFFGAVSWYMYYQSYHQKPMISGYLGRRPKRLHYPEHHLPFVRRFFLDEAGRSLVDMPPLALLPDPFWPTEILRGQELLGNAGIGHVLVHCSFLGQAECAKTNTLLRQSLWMPETDDGTLMHYRVQPSAYQTRFAPTYLTDPPLFFDAAFGALQIDAQGRLRTIEQSGEVTFTLPLFGIWSIEGELIGEDTAALRFALDGVDTTPQFVRTSAGLAFRLAQEMTPGEHTLRLALPTDAPPLEATEATNSGCLGRCVRNIHVQLKKPLLAPGAPPLATFVNEAGQRLELMATTIFTPAQRICSNRCTSVEEAGDTTPPPKLLLNAWRLDDQSYALLRSAPDQMPANYIHLTNADGDTLAQADHTLGERMLILTEESLIFDLVALPTIVSDLSVRATLELRLGLWHPTTHQYFWSPDATAMDGDGRVQLGTLSSLEKILPLPPLPHNPALMTTFTNPADGRTLRLLDAQILAVDEDPERLQLATIWEQPNLFLPEVSVTLFTHVTDDKGKTLQIADHALSTYRLIWHDGALIYDVLEFPWKLPLAQASSQEVRIGLWYPDNGQRYQADRNDLVDSDGRVQLGVIRDLQRMK